MYLIRIVNFGN